LINRDQCRGFSLLEMLVVLMITGLISALLMQGFMYMAGVFSSVDRQQQRVSASELQRGLFSDSVCSLVNGVDSELFSEPPFVGDNSGFKGLATSGLTYMGGVARPVYVEWYFRQREGRLQLVYRELSDRPDTESIDYVIASWLGSASATLNYLVDGEWRKVFEPADLFAVQRGERVRVLPDAIRIQVSDSRSGLDLIKRTCSEVLAYSSPKPSD
jgi:prepilin-type N-terminal cleavage/methylation domain